MERKFASLMRIDSRSMGTLGTMVKGCHNISLSYQRQRGQVLILDISVFQSFVLHA
jgi:hypothetical protein